MKVNRKELSDAVANLMKVVEKKASMPILRNVELRADGATLHLRTTDLNRTLMTSIKASGKLVACVNADKLLKVIKPDTGESKGKKADATVEIEATEASATVEIDGMKVKLPTLPVDDFPTEPTRKGWTVVASWDSKALASVLAYTLPAASVDFTRPHISAVALLADGRIAATDGHRLHVAPLPSKINGTDTIIPREAATTLAAVIKLGDTAVLATQDGMARFTVGAYELVMKLSESAFPPIDQVIPSRKNSEVTAVVNAGQWEKALKKLRAVSDDNRVGLKCIFGSDVTMILNDPDSGEVECQIKPVKGNDGDDKTIGVNGSPLFDALAGVDGNVEVMVWGVLDPIRIDTKDGKIAIVMPIRI